ncbi:MAG TPA: condensation domain-containing protein [Kofleriaceae bacterium]
MSADRIPAHGNAVTAPLSSGQKHLLLLDRLAPGWLIRRKLHIRGPLRADSLISALQDLDARHESLRTRIRIRDGIVMQEVVDRAFECPLHDLRQLDDGVRADLIAAIDRRHASTFDLVEGPLWRADLAQIDEHHHIVWFTLHDIIADGWSMALLATELPALYAARVDGRAPPLAPLSIRYADFAAWEQQQLASDVNASKLAYWRAHLDGVKPVALPRTGQRAPVRPAAHLSFDIPSDIADALRDICTGENVTLFVGLLTVFQLVLARGSGDDDIAITMFVANRDRPETRHLIGRFSNTVVLRSHLGSAVTFRDALRLVRTVVREGMARQDVPFEQVLSAVRAPSPFFNVLFSLNRQASPMRMAGLELTSEWAAPTHTAFDLSLSVIPQNDRSLGATWEYDAELIRQEDIVRLVVQLRRLVAYVAAGPDQPLAGLPFDRFIVEHTAPPTTEVIAPRDDLETALAVIWCDVLGRERVGVFDDFFALGGHSLLVLSLLARIRSTFDVEISVESIFSARTIDSQARLVRTANGEHRTAPTLHATDRRRGPLPAAQRGSYLLDRLAPDSSLNRLSSTVWLQGPVVPDELERALHLVRSRHAVLRTRIVADGARPVQAIVDDAPSRILQHVDLSSLSEDARVAAESDLLAGILRRRFALASGEVARVLLISHGPHRHRLTLVHHHTISDVVSLGIFEHELFAAWRGETLPPTGLQFLDLVDYLERLAQSPWGAQMQTFWNAQLDGASPILLPADRTRLDEVRATHGPPVPMETAAVSMNIDAVNAGAVEAFAKNTHTSTMSVLLTAFAVQLGELTGRTDLPINSYLSYRHLPGLERALGFFGNSLILRVSTADADRLPFAELVKRTHTTVARAYEHGEHDVLTNAADLFRVMFNYQYTADLSERSPPTPPDGISRAPATFPFEQSTVLAYELLVSIFAFKDRIKLTFHYSTELFDEALVNNWLHAFIERIETSVRA